MSTVSVVHSLSDDFLLIENSVLLFSIGSMHVGCQVILYFTSLLHCLAIYIVLHVGRLFILQMKAHIFKNYIIMYSPIIGIVD